MGDDETLGSITDEAGRPNRRRGMSGGGIFSNKPLMAVVGVAIIVAALIVNLIIRGGENKGGIYYFPIVENLAP
ncbi:MAG: hypothetical protein ABIH39_02695, partial [Candidatus Margulisiibacteriota bacterium]